MLRERLRHALRVRDVLAPHSRGLPIIFQSADAVRRSPTLQIQERRDNRVTGEHLTGLIRRVRVVHGVYITRV